MKADGPARRRAVRGPAATRQPAPGHRQRQVRRRHSADPKPKFSTHSFGCHFVEVTWQPEIARLRVSRVVTVIDAGRIINPLAGRNQIEGAVVMGIGMALFEHTYLRSAERRADQQQSGRLHRGGERRRAADRRAFPRLSRQGDQRTRRARDRRDRPGRHRRRDHGGGPSRNRRSRARTAGEDRRPAKIVSLGLTNEGFATNHPTRRRISCAAMGLGDIGLDARLDLSQSGRASVSRSEWGYAWFSDWRLP